jgi:hypothetical protein
MVAAALQTVQIVSIKVMEKLVWHSDGRTHIHLDGITAGLTDDPDARFVAMLPWVLQPGAGESAGPAVVHMS